MITLEKVNQPELEVGLKPVMITEATIRERLSKVVKKMKEKQQDVLVIYADLEHGGNFEYLAGFVPRFEEALLVLHQSGEAYMVLGNENLNKASKARIAVTPVHMPHLSLPNQPMFEQRTVADILSDCKLGEAKAIGLVGWKQFTSTSEDNLGIVDLPYFIVEALRTVAPQAIITNQTAIFIGEHGVRQTNNANELAHYEFGAALAGNSILNAMNALEEGVSEMDVASHLDAYGQYHNVVTILASGERFIDANIYPTDKRIAIGDAISMTTGFKGGLQSRGGYAVSNVSQLPNHANDYLERLAIPYYHAVTTWVQSIELESTGGSLYQTIAQNFPQKDYGWYLNPGHLCSDEEWMASPIYPESFEKIKSGMIFQIDIIPSISGYAGASCESGIMLADESLRNAIATDYPEMWQRIQARRQYMIHELGINLPKHVLPTSNATLYYRPLLLDKDRALRIVKGEQ
ncbi:Xaa-Pro aminopeptidase [Erysipelothrix sp. HDW6C]|uniref:M24 family metallopeptidase n=1 Tax=Erysipelothrix sp. HDW6C TaxID=2714930 RepID=UPI00140D4B45|nr:M24 family metallopeptidase [Erysipelothrix sp. HDW6C]QIK70275.1 Xaa-Pro aminopeptidase [Erysipelothrix sp. HDW6C]